MPRSSLIFLCYLLLYTWSLMNSCSASILVSSASWKLSSLTSGEPGVPVGSGCTYSWDAWLMRMHSHNLQYRNCRSPLSSRSRNCSIFLILCWSSSLSSMDFWPSSFLMRSLCWPPSKYLMACSLYVRSLPILSIFSVLSVFCNFSSFCAFCEFLAEFCNWLGFASFFGVLSLLLSGRGLRGSETGLSPTGESSWAGVEEAASGRLVSKLWLLESAARATGCCWG